MPNVISKLAKLGLSEYEAKAYLTLVQKHPVTAYEIAKTSGLPTSKIYEVLRRLLNKKLITTLEEGNLSGRLSSRGKKRFSPLQPEEFLNRYQSSMTDLVGSLKRDFSGFNQGDGVSYIWNVTDREDLLNKARRMIIGAKKVVLGSLWNQELHELENPFRTAEQRGIMVALVHFGMPKIGVGQVYYHPIEETLYAEKGARVLVLVVDSRQVLMGNIGEGNDTEGAWSENRGFAMIAEDYIKHDIYITKIIKRFDRDLIATFGERYAKLRDVFHDKDLLPLKEND